MFELVTINDKELKEVICESILRALPDWFGIKESIVNYAKTVKEMPFYGKVYTK